MGSFVESSNCYEMPFRTATKYEIFPPGTSDTVIIDTLAKSNISHIQATRAPTEEDIAILNEIFRRNPNIAFRIYSLSPEKVDLAILSRLTNLKLLYLDFWPKVDNIEVVQKLDLDYLSLSCFQVKDYSFLKNVSSTLKGLTVFLEDKTYKMDINYILHMTELERLGLRNVKRGLDKLNEFKNLEELSLRSTSITDYSFLKEMNVKKLYLAMQNAEYFNTFGNCESIEEIKIWMNRHLTDLTFLYQFPNLKKIEIDAQNKVKSIPDLRVFSKLEEFCFYRRDPQEIRNQCNPDVKIKTKYGCYADV